MIDLLVKGQVTTYWEKTKKKTKRKKKTKTKYLPK